MFRGLFKHCFTWGVTCLAGLGLSHVNAADAPVAGLPPVPANGVLCEFFENIEGSAVSNLTSAPDYPDSPSDIVYLKSFEIPADRADNYGTRVRGFVTAPEDGDYTFWVASDDGSELYLSTSEDPKGIQKIANVDQYTDNKQWDKFPSQKSKAIKLEKGKKYYIEALQKEGGGGDNLAVAWQLPSGAKEAPIPANRLTPVPASPKKPPPPKTPPELTVTSAVPNSPGAHWLFGTVKYRGKEFPVSFGVFLQKEYFANDKERFPVITTMHNVVGEVGGSDGGDKLLYEGLGLLMVKDIGSDTRHSGEWPPVKFNPRKEAHFIGIMPQCPKDKSCYSEPMSGTIVQEINWVEKNFRTDPDRNYLTGFSYGGSSTWYVGTQYPERFAAIVPLSARALPNPEMAPEVLKDVGVWCGVGELDGDFRKACTLMSDAFTAAKHPNFHFTVIKGGYHHCYQSIYGNPDFWKWLLEQKRKPKP